MRQTKHSNHIIWHLTAGMLIAYFVAFLALHGYSTRFEYLSFWEAVWRTISYVIPKWHLVIIPAGLIVSALSWAMYGLMRKLNGEGNSTSTALYFILTLLGTLFFLSIFQIYSLFIFVPLLGECLILKGIDKEQFADKPKRKVEDLLLS